MIPILFEADEKKFISNGIGRLAEALSCVVTEERNGIYELELDYPISGKYYSELQLTRIVFAMPADGKNPQPFSIYKITKPINGIITVYAQHISYQLSYIPVAPFTAGSALQALQMMKIHAAEACPFEFWTDKETVANYRQEVPESIRARLGGQAGSILDLYGGEYEWDRYNVILHNHRGADRGVTLRYGKNITDIEQEESIENTYTGIFPYYHDEKLTVMLPEKVLQSENADRFPFHRTLPVDFSSAFENTVPTQDQLRAKAQAYIRNNRIGVPKVSIKVSFVALWQTEEYKEIAVLERVNLCDTVHVCFEKLGIDTTAKVIKTEYDTLLERYNSIEIGEARSTLSKTIVENQSEVKEEIESTATFLEKAISYATSLLTGAEGGHVVMGTNADGQPNEIFIMDTDDTATATKILRMNMNGIGFASNFNGPYETAWTLDGRFVANYIATGELDANLLKVGIIMDVAMQNYWNMVTGEMQLSSETKTSDGVTLAQIKVNKDGISSEVNRASNMESHLSSVITQTAVQIRSEVANKEKDLKSSIEQNADLIATKVSAGDIASTINQTAQSVLIAASKINLSGYVTLSSLGANGTTTIDGSRITTGYISCNRLSGGTITGQTIQSAASGTRILMDTSSALKGYNNNTLYNVIDMAGNNHMTIDAKERIDIRTPKIYVANQSFGTGSGTVTETLDDDEHKYIYNVRKDYSNTEEGYVTMFNEAGSWNMYITLPVWVAYDGYNEKVVNGMLCTGRTAYSGRV